MSVNYVVKLHDLHAHLFEVALHVMPQTGACEHFLSLPAWIPGSYMIRDFARNIVSITLQGQSSAAQLHKLDKQNWRVAGVDGGFIVVYQVYAWDLSVRAAYLDQTRAFFNGTSLFLRVHGIETAPHRVTLEKPSQAAASDWVVSTTLPAIGIDARGFGDYQAASYAELIDFPVEIGRQQCLTFTAAGVPHEMAVTDGGQFDHERIARDLAPICEEHSAMFGELPVNRYLFLTLATADGYGGLEHPDSTSLICRRIDLPAITAGEPGRPDRNYRQFLALCSHEYFHLWNVKRIRPAVLATADLAAEAHTELLWAFEGITSYYDELALLRSGVLSLDEYLDMLATTVTRVIRGHGRHGQSVAESSFDAWTKFYKQDENAPNAIVSYYAKGTLVALGLDVLIREQSVGRLTLDDLMRKLWRERGAPDIGVRERELEQLLADMLDTDVSSFFERYVYGTDELPLEDWFAALGIGYRLRPAKDASDLGGVGKAEADTAPGSKGCSLGAVVATVDGMLAIQRVHFGQPAYEAGLAAGDQLLAINGQRVTESTLDPLLSQAEAGVGIELHYFRRGLLQTGVLPYREAPADTCELLAIPAEQLSEPQRVRRDAWLRTSRGAAD